MSQARLTSGGNFTTPPPPRSTGLRGRLAELGFWAVIGLALAYFIGSADWVSAALVIGLGAVGVFLVTSPKVIATLWMVGQPTFFVFPNNVASGVPFFTLERGLFLILLGLMLVRTLTRSGIRRPLNGLEWSILAFVGVLVCSFLTTLPLKDLKIVRSDIALLFQCYLMPWLSILIARRMDWTELDVLRFLRLLTVTGIALVAIGVLQFFFHVQWFTPRSFEVIHEGRTTGTFGNAVEYGSTLSGLAILTLAQFTMARDPLLRAVLLACCGAMVGGVIICLTRSPLVGLAAGLLVIYLGDPRIRSFLAGGAVVGLIGAILIIPLVLDTDALTARFEEMEPIYNRVALFATAGQMIGAYPLFGVGFGRYGFSDYKTAYLTGIGEIGAEWAASIGIPHLEYIHIAVLTGLVGLGCYILATRACIRTLRAISANKQTSPFTRTVAIYVLALLVSLIVNGLFVDFMAYNYFASLVYFMVGVTSVMRPDLPASRRPGETLPIG